ncbi:TldD/PmbA family protein [Methyloterricola oryzae]|uniref:TldD/PmbA family protein n=1 Tax=Methyloterricola oryzae TaxID=1495050 RepID=UPI0009E4E789|nr:TldD/PmbA family protein [Methyloterricola oryzae]
MTTTLQFRPQCSDFDAYTALKLVQGEADWVGLRFVEELTHRRTVRNARPENNSVGLERGVMLEAMVEGAIGYAATSDLSRQGMIEAVQRAVRLARLCAKHCQFRVSWQERPASRGRYISPRRLGLDSLSLAELTDQLVRACRILKVSDQIVSTSADATLVECTSRYVTSSGTDIDQQWLLVAQHFSATAQNGSEIQQRSMNGPVARCRQAGLEFFDFSAIHSECERVGREAVELLDAENCPNENLDLILAPDQMLLQIHESIGHPLELDRILGDERNYAGWSFVKPEDFGKLRYGSPLLNVTFDPTVEGEFASYAFDDCGNPAKREYLIKDGVLLRGLGSLESQARLRLPGVASFRASSWNRAPIDRMANINVEAGGSSLEDMISSIEKGVYMQANISWSIDDYRNKFQFGCEYARMIEHGRLTRVLKNPNYRGMTVPFWNSLAAVGNHDTWEVYGSRFCGKGEPSQIIRVGHAAPPCLFRKVDVFGGSQ